MLWCPTTGASATVGGNLRGEEPADVVDGHQAQGDRLLDHGDAPAAGLVVEPDPAQPPLGVAEGLALALRAARGPALGAVPGGDLLGVAVDVARRAWRGGVTERNVS